MDKKLVIGIILIIVILLGSYFIYQKIQNDNSSKIPVEGISEELINTKQEAVEYAKKQEDIKSFAERVKDLGVGYNTYYNEQLGVWQVVAYAKDVNDLNYQISFYPNGTITFTGPIPI